MTTNEGETNIWSISLTLKIEKKKKKGELKEKREEENGGRTIVHSKTRASDPESDGGSRKKGKGCLHTNSFCASGGGKN